MLKMQILEAIIEQQVIDAPFIEGEKAAFDPVGIYQHDHILQVVGEHVRFVTGR